MASRYEAHMDEEFEDRRHQLESGLLLFDRRRLIQRIQDVRDIYQHRYVLKRARFSAAIVGHLAGLIHAALVDGVRFRVFDSLKVLRAVLVSGGARPLPAETVARLFEIYRALILDSREEVEWCLSRLLKDRELSTEAVSWLLEHWEDSIHVLNRLLRYPAPDERIAAWALKRYEGGDLADRRSEVIAILLPVSGLRGFVEEDPETLSWAIMHSLAPHDCKVRWLRSIQSRVPARALVEYAVRLNAPAVVRAALKDAHQCGDRGEKPNKRLHPRALGAIVKRRG